MPLNVSGKIRKTKQRKLAAVKNEMIANGRGAVTARTDPSASWSKVISSHPRRDEIEMDCALALSHHTTYGAVADKWEISKTVVYRYSKNILGPKLQAFLGRTESDDEVTETIAEKLDRKLDEVYDFSMRGADLSLEHEKFPECAAFLARATEVVKTHGELSGEMGKESQQIRGLNLTNIIALPKILPENAGEISQGSGIIVDIGDVNR